MGSRAAAIARRHASGCARHYWSYGGLRGFITDGFRAFDVERNPELRGGDSLQPLYDAWAGGKLLIIFPEGTRTRKLLPSLFKAGLFGRVQRDPTVELVAACLDASRSMPKGSLCSRCR